MGKFESIKREELQKEAKGQLDKMVEEIIPMLKEKQLYSLGDLIYNHVLCEKEQEKRI